MTGFWRQVAKAANLVAKVEDERALIAAGTHKLWFDPETGVERVWRVPKGEQPRCGARCRDGHACRMRVVPGMARCRLHGGLSTGPTTSEGRERIAASNRSRTRQRAQEAAQKKFWREVQEGFEKKWRDVGLPLGEEAAAERRTQS